MQTDNNPSIREQLIKRRALYVAIAIELGYSNYNKLFDEIYNKLNLSEVVPRSKFSDFVFATVDRDDIRSLLLLITTNLHSKHRMDILIYGKHRYAETLKKIKLCTNTFQCINQYHNDTLQYVTESINILLNLFPLMDCNISDFLIDIINSNMVNGITLHKLISAIEKNVTGHCNISYRRPKDYNDSTEIRERHIILNIYAKCGDDNPYINYIIAQVVSHEFPIKLSLIEGNQYTPNIKKYEKLIIESKYKLASIERLIDADPIANKYFITNNSYTYDKKSLFKFKDYIEKLLERCNNLFSLCKINDELMEIIYSDGTNLRQLFRFVNKYKKEHINGMIRLFRIKSKVKYIMENIKNLLNNLSKFRCMRLQINYLIYLYGAEYLLYIKNIVDKSL